MTSRNEVFAAYLDYYRGLVVAKVAELAESELRHSRLTSGWTALEMLKHLRYVELRWIEWGFQGRQVDEPWGDWRDDRWHVDATETRDSLVAELTAQGAHTREVVLGNDLAAIGRPGPRWDGREPASLERVLFHLLQEYARHAGHLDIVAELAAADRPA